MPRREEIEEKLSDAVLRLLEQRKGRNLYSGIAKLLECGIDPDQAIDGASLSGGQLSSLLQDAESSNDAFDACVTLAGLQLRNRAQLDPALQRFAAGALLGEVSRSSKQGRSSGDRVYDDVTRYIILREAERFFQMQKGKGLRTEDGTKAKSEYPPDNDGMVAKALTESGLPTTESQLRNLRNHPSKATIRLVGDWAMQRD